MQIGIQLTPDGQRFEFDLVPDDEMWCLNPVGRRPVNRCNEAGLIIAFQLVRQTADRTAKQRERELKRCRWDLPWQCPHTHTCRVENRGRHKTAEGWLKFRLRITSVSCSRCVRCHYLNRT